MKCSSICRSSVTVCLLLIAGMPDVRAENWPQWRGPSYDGVSTEHGLPMSWSGTQNIAWKVSLPGMGGATPLVWDKRIFLTSEDNSTLVLLCLSTEGKQLWTRTLATTDKLRARKDEGNNASPSPSTDGKHVYAFVGTGDLACFDFEGNEVWHINAQQRYGKFQIQFGMHTTPLLYHGRLYLPLIHSGGAWIIAIDAATGKDVWKVTRPSDGHGECEHSYASPCLWHNGNDAYLVVHGNDYTTAHSLEDGREIWRLGDLNSKEKYKQDFRFVASPVATPELIVSPTAKNGPVVGVKPNATGLITSGSAGERWRKPTRTPDVPCPLVHDGIVYLCREDGILICLDAHTGEEYYNQRVYAGRHRASPVYADGKVYLTARDGTVSVVKAGRTYELLAKNKLPDDISASPAVANGRIYLRGFEALYAISQNGK